MAGQAHLLGRGLRWIGDPGNIDFGAELALVKDRLTASIAAA